MTSRAYFRFYEELNDYLSPEKKKIEFEQHFGDNNTVQGWLTDMGVPPEEVDLVLINSRSATFDQVIHDGDRVSVYPVFETFNITGVTKLRQRGLAEQAGKSKHNTERRKNGQAKNR